MMYIIIIEIKSLYTAAKTQGHAWNDVENGLAVKDTLIWMWVLTISSVWIINILIEWFRVILKILNEVIARW